MHKTHIIMPGCTIVLRHKEETEEPETTEAAATTDGEFTHKKNFSGEVRF